MTYRTTNATHDRAREMWDAALLRECPWAITDKQGRPMRGAGESS